MRKFGVHTAITVSLTVALAATPAMAATPGGRGGDSGVYIVQFEEPALADYRGPDALDKNAPRLAATSPVVTGARKLDVMTAESRAYRGFLGDKRAQRLEQASLRVGRDLQPTHVYDVVFNGIAVELDADEAGQLAKLPGIKHVERERIEYLQTDAGPAWIKADQLWSGAAGVQTRGEGVVVGVIDSGIHATHPSFAAVTSGYTHINPRGAFLGLCAEGKATCNGKLIGIYDFITEASEQTNGSDVNGHGSHVAGTAVGNPLAVTVSGAPRTVSGVAPRAHLISYKACWNKDSSGTCPGSATLQALQRAAVDQVDVVNYSIGGSALNPWASSNADAMRALRNAGVVVVVAAGNDGPNAGTVTSPGNAPWVITVAATSHTRATVNQLFLSGGGTTPPNGGVLVGASNTGGTAGAVPMVRPDPLLCAEGSNETGTAGENKPAAWSSSTYSGKMVLCDRGIYPRVAKSKNSELAGAAAMVLLNQASDGASVVSDSHSIPSTHLRYADAQALLQWVSVGTGHLGRLDAATLRDEPSFADLLANFSGRGPNTPDSVVGVMKPDVTAPGVSIIAADKSGTGFVSRSGTSMATPHVAGAAALLRAANPAWRANEIISALTTTARGSNRLSDGTTLATPFAQGNGTIDLSLAARAALSLNVSNADFVAANPASGGRPRNLNLPTLAHEDCRSTCSLTRQVTDLAGGGAWQVQFENLPAGMLASATPSQFTLAAGQTQAITFNFDVSNPALAGRWLHGKVRLKRTSNDGRPDATLALALNAVAGNLPARIEFANLASDAGFADFATSGQIALPDAHYAASALGAAETQTFSLQQDPTPNSPYDNLASVGVKLLTLPARSDGQPAEWRVWVEARGSTTNAFDYDLFVGTDSDGNGLPSSAEQQCVSHDPKGQLSERCEIAVQHPGGSTAVRVWVVVQNWESTSAGATDSVLLETVAFRREAADADGRLTVTGPGRVPAGDAFKMRVAWDDGTFLPGETRYGLLLLSATRNNVTGEIPVKLIRSGVTAAARALVPGRAATLRLPASAASDRVYFEVPPNATSVSFTMTGAPAVDLYAAHVASPSSPGIDPAPPRNQAQFSVTGSNATKTITISGAALLPGRWYVTPQNTQASASPAFTLTTSLTQTAPRPAMAAAHFFNPSRSGHGVFIDYAGAPPNQVWILTWYAYLQDGTPTWYFSSGPGPGPNEGSWVTPLYRSAWHGSDFTLTKVGDAVVTPLGANSLKFTYNLDGESGSERLERLVAGSCPVVGGSSLDANGHYFTSNTTVPGSEGFGYGVTIANVDSTNAVEFYATYIYDGLGQPRWLTAQRFFAPATEGNASSIALEQIDGFCPLCPYKSPGRTPVGFLDRNFVNVPRGAKEVGSFDLNVVFANGVPGNWSTSRPVFMVSTPTNCQ